MLPEQLIPANVFCERHHIDLAFIQSLQEFGLLEIVTIEETGFIHYDQLQQAEQLVRLHYELDINMAGLDVIAHLLQRVEGMQDEIRRLKNKLLNYEDMD